MREFNINHFNHDMDATVMTLANKYDDFYMLMKHNQGIHPIDIKKSLGRLYENNKIHRSKYTRLMISAKRHNIHVSTDMPDILPVPHILDYDWRFSYQGLKYMLKVLKKECDQKNSTIVFLGAPSLFKFCYNHAVLNAKLILVDINAEKHSAGVSPELAEFINCDLNETCDILNTIHADTIVMDPPWYFNYYQLFFDRASKMCHIGTKIFCIMPPKFTKAKTEIETRSLLEWLDNDYGFRKTHYYHGVVTYHTPPYEINVLKANGINCSPENWRVGDLLIVEKTVDRIIKYEKDYRVVEEEWDEVIIQNIRIKYRHSDEIIGNFAISFGGIFDKDVYPAVKRSFGGKGAISVWTSGNRVFWCDNIPVLNLIMQNIHRDLFNVIVENGYPPPTFEELERIEEVQSTIMNVVSLETKEYGSTWRIAI